MSKAIGTSKISSKYQVVIPESVRSKIDAKAGDILLFFMNDAGEIVIKVKV
ncbi:MAG: AbrB/MazE/SpoVT family DNA-binding domain-containing protein [Candidatus Hodarchaeales archaeon]